MVVSTMASGEKTRNMVWVTSSTKTIQNISENGAKMSVKGMVPTTIPMEINTKEIGIEILKMV